jgi:Protein of unknown function (DUF998)
LLPTSRQRPDQRQARAGAWARAAFAGVALYAAIDTALLFLRPQFSLLHSAESDYGSHGSWAWVMDLNFLLRCGLSLAAVRAIALGNANAERSPRLRVGLGLVTVWAIASGLLAFFPDDPAGTPTHTSGRVHLALAFVAFIAVLIGTIILARALAPAPRWQSVATAMTVLARGAVLPLLLLGHARLRPHSLGGLYEKAFLAIELVWLIVAVAPLALRSRRCPAPAEPGA